MEVPPDYQRLYDECLDAEDRGNQILANIPGYDEYTNGKFERILRPGRKPKWIGEFERKYKKELAAADRWFDRSNTIRQKLKRLFSKYKLSYKYLPPENRNSRRLGRVVRDLRKNTGENELYVDVDHQGNVLYHEEGNNEECGLDHTEVDVVRAIGNISMHTHPVRGPPSYKDFAHFVDMGLTEEYVIDPVMVYVLRRTPQTEKDMFKVWQTYLDFMNEYETHPYYRNLRNELKQRYGDGESYRIALMEIIVEETAKASGIRLYKYKKKF
jgi:hypothetical protein